jgi:hypothetical protein
MPERVSPIAAPTIMILIHTLHSGIGYAISGGFNPALPPNKSLSRQAKPRTLGNRRVSIEIR